MAGAGGRLTVACFGELMVITGALAGGGRFGEGAGGSGGGAIEEDPLEHSTRGRLFPAPLSDVGGHDVRQTGDASN